MIRMGAVFIHFSDKAVSSGVASTFLSANASSLLDIASLRQGSAISVDHTSTRAWSPSYGDVVSPKAGSARLVAFAAPSHGALARKFIMYFVSMDMFSRSGG